MKCIFFLLILKIRSYEVLCVLPSQIFFLFSYFAYSRNIFQFYSICSCTVFLFQKFLYVKHLFSSLSSSLLSLTHHSLGGIHIWIKLSLYKLYPINMIQQDPALIKVYPESAPKCLHLTLKNTPVWREAFIIWENDSRLFYYNHNLLQKFSNSDKGEEVEGKPREGHGRVNVRSGRS